jgi:4'-phosphopantetheinyl transferase EntD
LPHLIAVSWRKTVAEEPLLRVDDHQHAVVVVYERHLGRIATEAGRRMSGYSNRLHGALMFRGNPRPVSMIGTLVPASASAEMFYDAPESTMFPAVAAAVAGARPERRREFATVRHCARRALRQLGIAAVPILPDGDRAPRWPAGVVGSMTHCAGYRAAVVARSGELCGVGIDAEPHDALPPAVLDVVLREEERARLLELTDAHPGLHWDRIVFCAKEAVYKAWFPLTGRWLGFEDVSTAVQIDGTFQARPRVPGPEVAGLSGRWVVGRGLVVAATSVRQ